MDTLSTLEENPELFKSKSCKPLRALIHHLYKAMTATSGEGKSLTGRISDSLVAGRWEDALDDLKEMRARGRAPPLGALQRWVRDCDAASARDGAYGNPVVLRVLDSILRTADPKLVGKKDNTMIAHPVRRHPAWEPIPKETENEPPFYESSLSNTLYTPEEAERYKKSFRVVEHVKGPLRRTPNRYDLTLYLSSPGTVVFDSTKPPVTRIDVPNVPNAFVLTHVLSHSECKQVVSAAESMGFTGDAPLASESVSVLAHNFFWLADKEFLDTLVERCRPFLPPTMAGGELAGINARWRVYRYVPGAIYRPHIDGSWPGSGMCPKTDKYLFDAYGDRMSRLTFLIYLNDDAEGGSTTFFIPSHEVGFMDSYAVTPRKGCVLVFPHGEVAGSLLHEGSPVLSGAKYVIRADVLYMKGDKPAETNEEKSFGN
eukprot:Phypoly_transcript_03393.p1 GENE.Phypoly_transcript_03393~~Phypoly_transcript_03393.p1  ORF type:complete len:466 (-),score=86.12 Phypoly_transcript_03393:1075-2361(-)